jgi:hypothetical protein
MKDSLTRALDAHGGLSRCQEIGALQLKVSIGGGLWRLKGLPDGLRDVTLRIQADLPIVTITPFGGEVRTGHFTPERVWIEDANGGVVEERATPRASFAGHVLTTPWDKLQELYFVSYALWNYLATRSCSLNPASRPVRSGHTRKTARHGTASSSSIPQASRPTVPSRSCISTRKDYSSVWTTPWMWSATSSPVPPLTTASIIPRSVASSFRPYAGRSAALRRVQCYRVRRAYCHK